MQEEIEDPAVNDQENRHGEFAEVEKQITRDIARYHNYGDALSYHSKYLLWKKSSMWVWLCQLTSNLVLLATISVWIYAIYDGFLHQDGVGEVAIWAVVSILFLPCFMILCWFCTACMYQTNRWAQDDDGTDSMAGYGLMMVSISCTFCVFFCLLVTGLITLIMKFEKDDPDGVHDLWFVVATILPLVMLCVLLMGIHFSTNSESSCARSCFSNKMETMWWFASGHWAYACIELTSIGRWFCYRAFPCFQSQQSWHENRLVVENASTLRELKNIALLEELRSSFLPELGKYEPLRTYEAFEFGQEGFHPNCALDEVFQFVGSYSTWFVKAYRAEFEENLELNWCDTWCFHSPCRMCCASSEHKALHAYSPVSACWGCQDPGMHSEAGDDMYMTNI